MKTDKQEVQTELFNVKKPIAQICAWEVYPMELVECRRRFACEIIYYEKGTDFCNYKDKRNRKIVRKKVEDVISKAKEWKEKLINVDITGLYII